MKTRDELLKTQEYWFEILQNEIYRMVAEYIENEGINQTQLAEMLGVSKGYISQIMNGNFNYTLKKMIELSLALNKAPDFAFRDINEYIKEDLQKRLKMQYSTCFNVEIQAPSTIIRSGNKYRSKNVVESQVNYDQIAA